jgi:P-type Ca2+ transporter type 2C
MDQERTHIASEIRESRSWHSLAIRNVISNLGSDLSGLREEEARSRLGQFGYNELEREKKPSSVAVFLRQFKNVLVIILLAAALISFALGETVDAAVILGIVFAVSLLGFFQEYRAERALEALKRMAALTATVIRGGVESEIPARQLVPGDIVVLSVGDKGSADLRLIEAVNLRVDESALTGESVPSEKGIDPVPKDAPLAERLCVVYAGTVVSYGRGKGVVFSTGQQTEFGKIASMMRAAPKVKTPLELRIERVGRLLGTIMVLVAVLVLLLGLARGSPLLEMFLWAVSLAVAAVPEALPAVVTGGLAIGVRRMAKRNAIVRRLPAVETLGSTTVICSDKTGTMTKGQMTVRRIHLGEDFYEVTGAGYEPRGEILRDGTSSVNDDIALIAKVAVLCNDASFNATSALKIVGDPTEVALLVVAAKAGEREEKLRSAYPRVFEVPFTSERKRMTTVHNTPDGQLLCCMKGALEAVLPSCEAAYFQGRHVRLDEGMVRRIHSIGEQMAKDALRVLAFAYKTPPEELQALEESGSERGLVFLGLMGLMDPPREEVKDAVQKCYDAGIKVVMITGDHKGTAQAVAEELGLLSSGGRILTGTELDSLGPQEFDQVVEDVVVYARVSPEHKLRIVRALKGKGHIVAMTGDGVNDAPALKNADIGVAMGVTGTDVTKEAADVVLADDNFASIVAAVEEGRAIFDNIRKYLTFLLSANTGELLLMLSAGLLGYPLPLVPVQILFVNLATDGLPALALGIDPPMQDLMHRPPRDPKLSIFADLKGWIAGIAVLLSLAMMGLFAYSLMSGSLAEARSLVFASIILFELTFVFSCRSQSQTILRLGLTSNKYLVAAVLSQLMLLLLILYTPSIASLFEVSPIAFGNWSTVIAAGISGFIFAETAKAIAGRLRR